ncbi:MAG: PEP-CTERM sorting domain-containing protein [Verrucomicrobiales bacterium]|nr:PEP-CTERM sorting domain-containing protein [Verrucomicrobiales bacterium]
MDQKTGDRTLTRTWTLTDLDDPTPTLASNQGIDAISGSLTGGAALAGESFSLTFSASSGWNSTASATAVSNGLFETYLTTLTTQDVNGNAGSPDLGWGVNGGNNNNQIEAGEALVITWDTSDLDLLSQLSLSEIAFNNFTSTSRVDFVVYDVSADTPIFSTFGFDANNSDAMSGNWILEDGDLLVIAGGAGSAPFRFNTMTLDVEAVPEPSSVILLSGVLAVGIFFVRRRRQSVRQA